MTDDETSSGFKTVIEGDNFVSLACALQSAAISGGIEAPDRKHCRTVIMPLTDETGRIATSGDDVLAPAVPPAPTVKFPWNE
jgi:hypothetical protein